MSKSRNTRFPLDGWQHQHPQYASLPGQQSLFTESLSAPLAPEDFTSLPKQRSELFYTGKDLPGASETDQVLLWDVPK